MKKILLLLFLLPFFGYSQSISIPVETVEPVKPFLVVDNKPYEGSIYDINPYNVKSITILKDSAAIKKYGDKGINGVIEFELYKRKRRKK